MSEHRDNRLLDPKAEQLLRDAARSDAPSFPYPIVGGLGGLKLHGIALEHIRLNHVQLHDADFSLARLDNCHFDVDAFGCVFDGAVLTGGGLMGRYRRCSFKGATLATDTSLGHFEACDFSNANFTGRFGGLSHRLSRFDGANLSDASIHGANLFAASLRGAVLTDARMSDVILGAADLTGALGLASVRFMSPCVIDSRTVERSGELPRSFLRGAGLPDELIDLYEAFSGAIRFYTAFISYSTQQQDFAERVYADLQRENVRCWLASEHLKIGDRFRQAIDEAIRFHDKLLLVFSQSAIESEWVEDEVNAALARERETGESILFPVTVDDAIWDTREAWARRHQGQTSHR